MIIMKKIKIYGVFIIMTLSVLSHFAYEWFNNFIFSILFPVNECIWEHMKLMITPVLLFSFFEFFLYKKNKNKINNFYFSYAISILVGIASYLTIYLFIHYFIGHFMLLSIFLLFLDYILIEFLSYFIMNTSNIKYSNIIGCFLIVIMYFIFYYLTYYPPNTYLFYDTKSGSYGILKTE